MRLVVILGWMIACWAGNAHAQSGSGALIWEFRTGGPIWSSPSYRDNILYFGSDDGKVYALDTVTQKPKWTYQTGGKVRSAAALSEDRLYIASDDGFLYALDREAGRELWRFDMKASDLRRRPPSKDNPYFDFLQSSPLVHQGKVYIGSLNGAVFAVDAESGNQVWSLGTGEAIRSTPVIGNGKLYFGSWDDHLYAVSLPSHEFAWRSDSGGVIQSTPSIGSNVVVIGTRAGRLIAYDPETGAEKWRHDYPDGSWVESSAVHDDGRFYVGSSDALKISAFAADGSGEIWNFRTGGWTWAPPLVADGTVYIGSVSAHPYYFEGVTLQRGFYALDAETGQEKWRFIPGEVEGYITGGVAASPAVTERVVYVPSVDGSIYALRR